MPASPAGHEPDAAVLAGQLQAAQLETEQLKRELELAKADQTQPAKADQTQPAARPKASPKRVGKAAASQYRAEGKKPAYGSGDDDGGGGDDGSGDGGGGGGGGGARKPSSESEEYDLEPVDELFGDDQLEAPGAGHGSAMYKGHLLGCQYDPDNPFPRCHGPLRTRTCHYQCATAGDTLNAAMQDARTPDGKFALGEGVRRELSTHIPVLSYLHDFGVTLGALSVAVHAGRKGSSADAVETLAVVEDALKACIQQQRAIAHFVLERADEIEQLAIGDRTTAAQFNPFYRAARVRSDFGTQMLERNTALEHRALASIAARASARAAAGGPSTSSAGRGAANARARQALAAKLQSAAGAKGGAAFGAVPEGGAKSEGGKGAKGAKGAGGRDGGRDRGRGGGRA